MNRSRKLSGAKQRDSITRAQYRKHKCYRWERLSKAMRKGRVCVYCNRMGRATPSQVTDHIIPHKGDYDLFWDTSNMQVLCKPCHDRKSWRESVGMEIRWKEHPTRFVIFGRPASGKSSFWERTFKGEQFYDDEVGLRIRTQRGVAAVWDMDDEATRLRFHSYPRWPHELDVLIERRDRFIDSVTKDFFLWAIIVGRDEVAYRIAQEKRATLVEAWAPDHVREQRMKERTVDGQYRPRPWLQ